LLHRVQPAHDDAPTPAWASIPGANILRRRDGRYECTLCGAVLDIPEDKVPLVVITAASGEPNMRAIMVEGTEIHRCPIDPDAK
jgi:hypothetical protein